jgi:hypothetical protein
MQGISNQNDILKETIRTHFGYLSKHYTISSYCPDEPATSRMMSGVLASKSTEQEYPSLTVDGAMP